MSPCVAAAGVCLLASHGHRVNCFLWSERSSGLTELRCLSHLRLCFHALCYKMRRSPAPPPLPPRLGTNTQALSHVRDPVHPRRRVSGDGGGVIKSLGRLMGPLGSVRCGAGSRLSTNGEADSGISQGRVFGSPSLWPCRIQCDATYS